MNPTNRKPLRLDFCAAPPAVHTAMTVIGALALLAFGVLLWKARWNQYSDLDQVYLAGMAWRRGIPPYSGYLLPTFGPSGGPNNDVLAVYYYWPLCGMLAAPLTLLPFFTVVALYKFVAFPLLLFGVWRFSRLVFPDCPNSFRLLVLGVTSLAGSLRWNLIQSQPSALVVALVLLFACAALEKRWKLSVILGVLISIKISYLLPVVGLLLFLRRYKVLGAMLGIIVVVNGLALLPTGPGQTLAAYRASMQDFESPGKMTYPSALDFLTPYLPDHPDSPLAGYLQTRQGKKWAGEQVHFTFLFSAWGLSVPQAKLLALAADVGLLVWLGLLWRRAGREDLLANPAFSCRLFAALLGLSLLMVYHQRYDAIALIPIALVGLAALRENARSALAWVAFLCAFVLAYLLSAGLLQKAQITLGVRHGWLFAVPICSYLIVGAAFAALLLTQQMANGPAAHRLPTINQPDPTTRPA